MNPDRLEQIEDLYHAALDVPPEERPAYLADACGSDRALRKEVESLLGHADHSGFLETAAIETVAREWSEESLKEGQTIGPYEIVSLLGRGGMGEVYRARDTKLGREVAVKTLPESFELDPDRINRFEREARLLASLNHPHICTLHDVGHESGVHYLVMELVEGDTLAAKLENGRLKLDQALEYAGQIADALDRAHRQGVVHRDLKPGNIMLTRSGVKLLDFGLAKLTRTAPAVSPLSEAPTAAQSEPLTAEGSIVGTLQYMAPEQLEAREVDQRADIFAFGAIVYEMVTGQKAFAGDSQASLIGAILKDDPAPMSSIQAITPPTLDHVVRRCLAKDPDERWQTAADLRHELKWAMEAAATSGPAIQPTPWTTTVAVAVGSFVAGALIVAAVSLVSSDTLPSAEVSRLTLEIEDGVHLGHSGVNTEPRQGRPNGMAFDVAPDGQSLAFVGWEGDRQQLYVRRMDQSQAVAIAGTERFVTFGPFFAPDGQSLGFFNLDGELLRVPVDGGEVRTVATAGPEFIPMYGASWTDDDTILLSGNAGVLEVSAEGGTLAQLTDPGTPADSRMRQRRGLYSPPGPNDIIHAQPQMLPGGEAVLYSILELGEWTVVVESLETDDRVVVTDEGSSPRYLDSGHIVFARSGTLMAVPFDVNRLEVAGDPVIVLEDVMHSLLVGDRSINTGLAQFSVSDAGNLVYVPGGTAATRTSQLNWVSRDGTAEPIPLPADVYDYPRISPGGNRLAYVKGDLTEDDNQLWVYDIDLGIEVPLPSVGDTAEIEWSPDGDQIVTTMQPEGGSVNLYLIDPDGSGSPARLTDSEQDQHLGDWSENGVIAFVQGLGVMTLAMDGQNDPVPFLDSSYREGWPAFSPDGNWLAYASRLTGTDAIYVRRFPGEGPAYRVSNDGGSSPLWSPDGDELFYMVGGAEPAMFAVDVSTGDTFTRSSPRLLFEFPGFGADWTRTYDITPDGERFVMTFRVPFVIEPVARLNVVQNWFEELVERVPVQ